MSRVFRVMITAVVIWSVLLQPFCVLAAGQTAEDMTADIRFSGTGYGSMAFLHDGDRADYRTATGETVINLQSDRVMAGLYLMFDLECGPYTVIDPATGAVFTAGMNGFLHEYIDLETAFGTVKSVSLTFPDGVRLSEIRVFSSGTLPDNVQRWSAPLDGGADLVLFSTHGDDEHLYFAGLLPTYGAERGCRVQVVYLTDHRNDTNRRTHEMLNGLWNVGIRAYPVFGSFADFRIDSLQGTYDQYKNQYGVSRDELLDFVVTQIRRFRPLVAVGHDLQGEYGHGMHLVYADLLTEAVLVTDDPTVFPESAKTYGTWQIPKLYLHLYGREHTVIDYDTPLEAFDGMTAFRVSQKLGFPSHRSQQWPMFVNWIYGEDGQITKASQIDTYNPAYFGLYHSEVGPDIEKNDFFENLLTYSQQEEQARLEQERLEQERLEQERLEQERLEQERLEKERLEQERLEQIRLEQELQEQERLEQARLEQARLEQERRKTGLLLIGILLTVGAVLVIVLVRLLSKRKRRAYVRSGKGHNKNTP